MHNDPIAAVKEMLAEVYREAGEDAPDVDDDAIAKALAEHGIEATGEAFDSSKHPRGQPGNAGEFGPGGGGKTDKKGSKKDEKQPRVKEQVPSAKAALAKASHKMVNKEIQRYAEEYNEPRFAHIIGGHSLPDGEPIDVHTAKDGIELKTMVDNKNGKLTMDSYAQVRKILWEQENAKLFHTVVSDDQKVYEKGKVFTGTPPHSDANRVYYYRRGVAGSARVHTMHKCKDEAEVQKLMRMPDNELPAAAQRTDGRLRVGKWKPGNDEQGKFFKNRTTGQIVRAKK